MIPNELKNMKPLTGDERFERDSEYLGAVDIDKGASPVLTIKHIYRGLITLPRGKEVKNVMEFVEETAPGIGTVRPLIVNEVNRKTLHKLFGSVTASALVGKKIQLYLQSGVRNPSKNEVGDGIRIREYKEGEKYEPPKCEACGNPIAGTPSFSPEQLAQASKNKYGKALCVECGKKAKAAAEQKATEETTDKAVKKETSGLAEQLAAGLDE